MGLGVLKIEMEYVKAAVAYGGLVDLLIQSAQPLVVNVRPFGQSVIAI